MIYPARSERVQRILRRIIRGLCHEHALGSQIADDRVLVEVLEGDIAAEYKPLFKEYTVIEKFCRYSYHHREDNVGIHSVWVIEFYGRTRFFGIVSELGDGLASGAA